MSTHHAQEPREQLQAVTSLPVALEPVIWRFNEDSSDSREGGLAARVFWSRKAVRDLKAIVTASAVRDQLKCNAEEILHDILSEWRPRCVDVGDAGAAGEVMWHRGVPHEYELLPEQANSTEGYFLFYRLLSSVPEFEILAVRSIYQAARRWEQMTRSQLIRQLRYPKRRLPWSLRR